MKRLSKIYASFLAFFWATLMPAAVFAQTPIPTVRVNPTGDIKTVISNATNIIAGIAGAVAILIVIVGGVMYMVSGQDQGKKMITQGLTGLAIVILAYVLVRVIIQVTGG